MKMRVKGSCRLLLLLLLVEHALERSLDLLNEGAQEAE
jgi:hypothetical protein